MSTVTPLTDSELQQYERSWKTMGEEAYVMLRGAILSGVLDPGQRLRINDICRVSGMSRMPVREALAGLQRIGLVEMSPRHIARVAELSEADLKDVFDARLSLEVSAIAAAALHPDEGDIARARDWLERLQVTLGGEDLPSALKAHAAFHFALYGALSSRWLIRVVEPLWFSSERYVQVFVGSAAALLEAERDEHERLLAACERGDSELAATLLWNHLACAGNLVSRKMGGGALYERRSGTELGVTGERLGRS
ncbi:MAG TPA: GntR family transcriptional regulator [Solirubrobacterales bacterium]|nr:GntR family transcriptional regulator [Solirubrobacterales bacterium]